MQASSVKDPIECFSHVRFVERRPRNGREDPHREGLAVLEPRGSLLATPQVEFCSKLPGQVDAALLVILRRRELAANEIPAHDEKRAAPVQIAPLQRQQLASAQPGP